MNVHLKEVGIELEEPSKGPELYDFVVRELRRIFAGRQIIRWAITKVDQKHLNLVATVVDAFPSIPYEILELPTAGDRSPFAVIELVPTGVGASIGGYAGDAAPTARLLASVADTVITHPNVLNAADFYGGIENTLYVEGFTLDHFVLGHIALSPKRSNRIGLVVDDAEHGELDRIFKAADAVRSVYGIDIVGYSLVKGGIGGVAQKTSQGTYDGYVKNPKGLLKAAENLISRGASAIAIISNISGVSEEEILENYRGISPHPMGGVEATISRLVSSYFSVPAAHAPILNGHAEETAANKFACDPRAAAEVISRTALPCVLLGLSKAPTVIKLSEASLRQAFSTHVLTIGNVRAIVVPSSAMGGLPVLACEKLGIPIISVVENCTVLDVTGDKLGITNEIRASNYLEAAGIVTALKAGIDWRALRRPIGELKQV